MWPLIAVLGLVLAFGALSGGNFSPNSASAEITVSDTDDDKNTDDNCENEDGCVGLWYFFDYTGDLNNEQCLGNPYVQDIASSVKKVDIKDTINLALEGQNSVYICVELNSADDTSLEFDSDDYGTWEEAWCADESFPGWDFEDDDECDDTTGLGTDHLSINCETSGDCEANGGSGEDWGGDVVALFECHKNNAGRATITISHGDQNDNEPNLNKVQFTIICWDEADEGDIKCEPCKVEIVPALGSTQYSLVYVKLRDSDGNPARPGADVTWLTDNCEISDDSFARVLIDPNIDNDLDTFDEIEDIFQEYRGYASPANADNIHDFVDDFFDPDWDDEGEDFTFNEEPWDLDDDFEDMDTFTAVILNCGAGHDAKPGIATVTALIEVLNDPDLVFEIDVTVVGPPASVTIVADPAGSVRCGERVQLTVTIKDAKGAPVSDHTLLEAVTNFGGVLGGTGAVAGQQGLVTPVASTVAETFGGVATFWLLTSETHAGPYEVIVASGGGGGVAGFFSTNDRDNFDGQRASGSEGIFDFDRDPQYQQRLGGLFSTPVEVGRVAVACTIPAAVAPAPAATVRAPATGQGIVPPNTGDAGLAGASGNSMMLFVIAGMAVVAVAGVAGVKLVRR